MDTNNDTIGSKIKNIRMRKNCTLKQLSEESGLSIGYLSQFERGMSSIALDSLEKLCTILGVNLSDFFKKDTSAGQNDPVSYWVNLQPNEISPQIYQYFLGNQSGDFDMLTRVFLLMPFSEADAAPELYSHEGQEFLYVLEGIVTVYLEDRQYVLYPNDSIQIESRKKHNWMNRTNKTAKILTVNIPNPFRQPPHAADSDQPR